MSKSDAARHLTTLPKQHFQCKKKETDSRSKFYPVKGALTFLLLNIVWIIDAETSKFILSDSSYDKPYFFTWVNMSSYVIFLLGFCLVSQWRRQCLRCACQDETGSYSPLVLSEDDEYDTEDDDGISIGSFFKKKSTFSEPQYLSAYPSSDAESIATGSNEKSDQGDKPPRKNKKIKWEIIKINSVSSFIKL